MTAGCVHGGDTTCARWCLRTFAKCFVVGSGAKTLLNVLVFMAFRRGRALTPRLLVRTLLDVRYGLFLGTYASAWKLVSCLSRAALLRHTRWRRPPLPCHRCHHHPHHQQQQEKLASSSSSSMSPASSSGSEVAALPGSLARPCSSLALEEEEEEEHKVPPHTPDYRGTPVHDHDHDHDHELAEGEGEEGEPEMRARERYGLWAADLAAGAASGLALYWLPKGDRKGLALYGFTRSGEFLARFLSSNRLLPPFLERLAPHVDVALMTLSASQILFSYIMERDTLDPTYSSFLIKFGGKDVRVIDSIAPLRRGGKLNRAMFMEWAREHQLKDVMGILFGLHHYHICDVVHPGTNCVSHFLGFTYEAFWRAFPMYATLHSVTTLVFLLLKLRSFVVARGFHRSLVQPPAADAGLLVAGDHAPYGDELPPCPRDANSACERRLPSDAKNENGDRGLALHRDDSMRALHSAKDKVDNNEEEEEDKEDKEEERRRKSIEKRRRGLSTRELARMVSCCVRNLWSYLRSPGHVCILLRFVLTQVLPKLALNIARSSLFLGLYCASGWFGACIAQRSFLMKDVRWFYPVLALPGLASLIEVPARRRELALYCLPKAMESCYAVCRKYDLIPRPMQYFKNGEVFLFSVSSALTLFCYVNGKQSIKPTFLHLMNWLWA